jgi:amino acid transporter
MPILFFQGTIVTVLALVFVVAPNTSAAFALLQDVSIILYMCMYVVMFSAAIRLRHSQPEVARPIRVPALPVIATVGILAALSAIILGVTPPAGYSAVSAPVYAGIVVVGVVFLAIPAQLIYRYRRPEWTSTGKGSQRRD